MLREVQAPDLKGPSSHPFLLWPAPTPILLSFPESLLIGRPPFPFPWSTTRCCLLARPGTGYDDGLAVGLRWGLPFLSCPLYTFVGALVLLYLCSREFFPLRPCSYAPTLLSPTRCFFWHFSRSSPLPPFSFLSFRLQWTTWTMIESKGRTPSRHTDDALPFLSFHSPSRPPRNNPGSQPPLSFLDCRPLPTTSPLLFFLTNFRGPLF